MNIDNYYRSGGQLEIIKNNDHCSSSCTTINKNNQMSCMVKELSIGNQILLPDKVNEEPNEVLKNEYEINQKHLENEMQVSSAFSSNSAELSFFENQDITQNNTDLRSYNDLDLTNIGSEYIELGKTSDIYLSVFDQDLNTLHLSDKDKFWITESALRAIPFGNNDIRKWSAEDVVFYLNKFSTISSPIDYSNYYNIDKQTNIFESFINQDIIGEIFLLLTLTDLLMVIKPPRRRQILIIYGAILILRKYTAIYFTKCVETFGSDCTGIENPIVEHGIPNELLNLDLYFSVLEGELDVLGLSNKDKFWITKSALDALSMLSTNDIRKWSPKDVVLYLEEFFKIASPINYSNNRDAVKQTTIFGKFITENIHGVAFLMLYQWDLLNLFKSPGRRQVLIIYGAILVLRKYSLIFLKDN